MLVTSRQAAADNSFKARLMTLMSKAKLTQSALAAELGVGQSAVAYYLSPTTQNKRTSYAVGQKLEAAERKYANELAA